MLDKIKQREERFEQIDRISARFTEIWKKYPDLKFNQLLYYINCMSEVIDTDFYYIDDDEFELDMERSTSTSGHLYQEGSN